MEIRDTVFSPATKNAQRSTEYLQKTIRASRSRASVSGVRLSRSFKDAAKNLQLINEKDLNTLPKFYKPFSGEPLRIEEPAPPPFVINEDRKIESGKPVYIEVAQSIEIFIGPIHELHGHVTPTTPQNRGGKTIYCGASSSTNERQSLGK